MASTYLTRTPASAGNRKTWTYSAWFKIGNVSTGPKRLLTSYDGSAISYQSTISYGGASDYAMQIYNAPSGSATINLITNRLFRDCNAWYHIVISVDTTQATESDRVKLYVNGVQETSFSTELYGSQNEDFWINSNQLHTIGRRQDNSQYFDGSMAHIHFIDGTAYGASAFGLTDATTGIWKPKPAPSVTYGTNGFFLKFANSGSMGTDSSGNGNNFTVNGNLTQTQDTPSNVFATFNPLNEISSVAYSDINQTFTNSSSTNRLAYSNYSFTKGKYYCEIKVVGHYNNYTHIGLNKIGDYTLTNAYVNRPTNEKVSYLNDGRVFIHGGTLNSTGITYTTGDIIGMACDMDNGYLYYHKNGVYINSGDPTSGASGTGGFDIYNHGNVDYCFAVSNFDNGTDPVISANFGNGYFGTTAVSSAQSPSDGIGIFEYSVPSGYKALCTKSINAQEYS